MVELACDRRGGPTNLKEIATRQEISLCYLEQLLRKLRNAGLVKSIRGPLGGFLLTRAPSEIRVWEIIVALEPDVAPVHCVDEIAGRPRKRKPCPRARTCPTRELWAGLTRQIRDFLHARTLQDLADTAVKDRTVRGGDECGMFYI